VYVGDERITNIAVTQTFFSPGKERIGGMNTDKLWILASGIIGGAFCTLLALGIIK